MLFNSIEFFLFLPLVFCLYWFVTNRNLRLQNLLILASSYVFYGAWDWRFLLLIFFSSAADFTIGWLMGSTPEHQKRRRKLLLWLSLALNLGILGFFKYYNFFTDALIDLLQGFGLHANYRTLYIILPVGISFYTFQTLSYTIDIYRGKLKPSKDPIAFFAFVSFFPQLVAGPIERASNLLPQFEKKRSFDFDQARDGARQMLWGFFKKIVIADNCGILVDTVFADIGGSSGSMILLALCYFSFQIYCDFSGYSDIAIGCAKLFGIGLMDNFKYPYFARNIGEFWRRWHISLSTWFRDYLYIPLGGSRVSQKRAIFNVMAIFLVSGFWHGANWTFILWGFLHGLFFIPLLLMGQNRSYLDVAANDRILPSIKELFLIGLTFLMTTLAWIPFRAESLSHVGEIINGLMSSSLLSIPPMMKMIPYIAVFVLIEWWGRRKRYPLENLEFAKPVRWGIYLTLFAAIFLLGDFSQKGEFIYFQF